MIRTEISSKWGRQCRMANTITGIRIVLSIGVYQTPQAYYVDDADVEEFDKNFPAKEKLKLPDQIFG